MRRLLRIALWCACIFFVVVPLLFIFFAIEHSPAVVDVKTMNIDDAVRTRSFVRKAVRILLKNNDRPVAISATEDDLNGIFAIAHRSSKRIAGRTVISPQELNTSATITIPHTPWGDYINVHLKLLPSESGVHFEQVSLGRISLPDAVTRFITGLGLDLAFGFGEGRELLEAVDFVALTDSQVDVHLKAIPQMNQLIKKMKGRLGAFRDEARVMGDPDLVRDYYRHIMAISEQTSREESVSLGFYIGRLFEIARNQEGDAALENRAAILALGIYFGSWRVEQMIGPVRTKEMLRHHRLTSHVGLSGRRDLRLHFILSAALEIASESGVTHAAGEFKELLDAEEGGSGFSFVDLAADRAGVRFAEMATDPATAEKIQHHLSVNYSEDQFFPEIKNLPEGLSKKVFEDHFGDLESERYSALVRDVDVCLSQLPAYALRGAQSRAGGCDITYVVPEALLS